MHVVHVFTQKKMATIDSLLDALEVNKLYFIHYIRTINASNKCL